MVVFMHGHPHPGMWAAMLHRETRVVNLVGHVV